VKAESIAAPAVIWIASVFKKWSLLWRHYVPLFNSTIYSILENSLTSCKPFFPLTLKEARNKVGCEKVVDFSPRAKFIAITVDELILVPIAMWIVYTFKPDWFLPATILLIIGAAIFVAGKYYIVYPSLLDEATPFYELVGMKGVVIDDVTQVTGKIRVGAEIWDARCDVGEIKSGTEIVVVSRESMRVRVEPFSKTTARN
jgi:membrane protein implicated in regulation of membrane protease activity